MNDLERYFFSNKKRLIHKWHHYFEIYDRHFDRFRDQGVIILEIGVSHGGSLQMWKEYFGDQARIIGVDIDPRCKDLEEEQIEIFIGSQSDKAFLRQLKAQIPPVDILIDDGGHFMKQQIVLFEEMFDHVRDGGIYLCEDMHTSYWKEYGGGYKKRSSFVEYSKSFIDYINAWHSRSRKLKVSEFTRTVHSVHFYDSIIVIEKRLRERPTDSMTGNESF